MSDMMWCGERKLQGKMRWDLYCIV